MPDVVEAVFSHSLKRQQISTLASGSLKRDLLATLGEDYPGY
jgi:hypothetical protein